MALTNTEVVFRVLGVAAGARLMFTVTTWQESALCSMDLRGTDDRCAKAPSALGPLVWAGGPLAYGLLSLDDAQGTLVSFDLSSPRFTVAATGPLMAGAAFFDGLDINRDGCPDLLHVLGPDERLIRRSTRDLASADLPQCSYHEECPVADTTPSSSIVFAPRPVVVDDLDADGQRDAVVGLSFDGLAAYVLDSSTPRLREIPVAGDRLHARTTFTDIAAHGGAYLLVSRDGRSLVHAVYDRDRHLLAPDVVTSVEREIDEPLGRDGEVSFAGSPPLLVVSRRNAADVTVYRVREHPAPGAFVGPRVAHFAARATRALEAAQQRDMDRYLER